MLQIMPNQLDRIGKHCNKSLAGEVCRIIEEFQKNGKDLNDEATINLLKELLKNKIHESGRYRNNLIEQFSQGLTYFNVEFAKPTDKKK